MRRFALHALAVLTLAAGGAAAAPAAPARPQAPEPTTVSEVIVTATKAIAELTVTGEVKCLAPLATGERATRPKIVSTFPRKDQTVRPGLLVVRVTFDQPMTCSGVFTAAPSIPNPCPGEIRDMLLSLDRKTIRTVCLVEANVQYAAWVTQDPTAHGFMGLTGLPSEARQLAFVTSAEAPVTSVCEALLEDVETAAGLRDRLKGGCPSGG